MLKPYNRPVDEVAFVYGHAGLKADNGNRIYEVAATILSRDASRRNFSSLVRYPYLTERERYHSNISKESLHEAPPAEEVAVRLRSFLEKQAFVLVLDPYSALDLLLRFCAKDRFVDLTFAAEYFLPHVESFSPRGLWEYLSGKRREKISFSASELVDLSIELVRHLCGDRLNDETQPSSAALRHYLKMSDTLFGDVMIHLVQHYQEYWGGLFSPVARNDTADWMPFLEKARFSPALTRNQEDRRTIPEQRIETLLKGLAEGAPGFKFRDAQLKYSLCVTEALNDGAVLTLEAGTGTGKTQGYLIPVMDYLRLNPDERVMISTYTKSLQDQIHSREIPRTMALERDFRNIPVALLKGKSNYLCAEKLNSAFEEDLKGAQLLTWLYFANLIFLFRHADGETVGERVDRHLNTSPYFRRLHSEISAKTGCTGRHILCPAQVARAEARSARVVVTNHHKLALIDLDEELSGMFRNCIIDEANHFEQAVRNAFRLSVNSREMMDTLSYLELVLHRVLHNAAGDVEASIDQCRNLLEELQQAVEEFGHILRRIFPSSARGEILQLPLCHAAYADGKIEKALQMFADLLKALAGSLSFLEDPDTCRALKLLPRSQERIKNASARILSDAENFLLLEKTIRSDNMVAACQLYSRHWVLMVHAVDVSGLIQKHIYDRRDCIVYTSATLRQRDRFDDFSKIVGMDCTDQENAASTPGGDEQPVMLGWKERPFRFSTLRSPFSRDAVKMILPEGVVSGSYGNKQVWLKTVAELMPALIRRNRGRTLVLFSSYSDLEAVAVLTGDEIAADGFPLLLQAPGQSTGNLIDEFRLIKESVLFGVDTFWYGVDFQGDTLTQVIITRIPFPHPFDPLQIARKRMLPAKEFWNRYYYEAMIKLKQGIGRLIRSENDRGQVVFLDSRCRHFEELWQ